MNILLFVLFLYLYFLVLFNAQQCFLIRKSNKRNYFEKIRLTMIIEVQSCSRVL